MIKRVDEYVQVNNVELIKKQLSDSNYQVLEAINKTNIIRELVTEKEAAIKLARQISKSLLPEVQLLATYVRNEEPPIEEDIYIHKKKKKTTHKKTIVRVTKTKTKTKPKSKATKGRQVNLKSESKTLTELKRNLAKIRRQLNE